MVLKAVAYWLDRYGLVFSDRSKFTGASYTDVHAALPAKTILFWIAIVIAGLGVLASMWLRSALLPGIGFVVAARAEHPDQRHLPGDRAAGLGQAERQRQGSAVHQAQHQGDARRRTTSSPDADEPTARSTYKTLPRRPDAESAALDHDRTRRSSNIRILDPNVISPTFTQLQQIAATSTASPTKLDVDRYTDRRRRRHDYIVGVRELDAGEPHRRPDATGSTSTPSTPTATASSRPRPNADITNGKTALTPRATSRRSAADEPSR